MIEVAAPAKINLYLHVTGLRDDGYHRLDSLIVFAGIGDTVAVEAADGGGLALTIDGPFAERLDGGPGNLVIQAAQALAKDAGIAPRARIRLTKRLPVAAGIGGGSADAAAAIRALVRLWALDPAPQRLHEIALSLGADVPVCLAGRAAFIGGAGGEIAPAPNLPPAWLVLANPGRALATEAVFKARTGPFTKPARFTEAPADAARLARLIEARRNDLTAAAAGIVPEINQTIAALAAQPGALASRLSGSGATCFALFAGEDNARAAAALLAARYPDWWIEAAVML